MPKPRTGRRQNRGLSRLLEKGALACALGIAALIAPAVFNPTSAMHTLALSLRTPAWLLVGLGLALIGAYLALKPKTAAAEALHVVDQERFAQPRKPLAQARTPSMPNEPATPRHKPATLWSPAVFAAIEWRRFEAVCEALLTQNGLTSRTQSHGADGGVDIWLYSRNAETPVAVVQCKHWQNKRVGVKEVREFYGVMASHQLQRGVYASTSGFTADALAFAQANGVTTMDGQALLALIAQRTPEQQQALLDVAQEGEYWRPTCASCGVKMLERTKAKGGAAFWGCSHYPRCTFTLVMPTRH